MIDIGCGFGDFAKFLIEFKIPFRSYLDVDINGNLLDETKKMNVLSNMSFQKLNILSDGHYKGCGYCSYVWSA